MAIPNPNRMFYLPRLPREYYQGDAVVHWTLAIEERGRGWLNDRFHARFRETMLHAAARERLLCAVYCLMPDHIHLVWLGLQLDSNQRNAMAFLRRHLREDLAPWQFQHQAHDHVLKEAERRRNAFARVCFYIAENPVRAKLVKTAEDWAFTGAVLPGYPSMYPLAADYWDKFWRLLSQQRHPDAGQIKRPRY